MANPVGADTQDDLILAHALADTADAIATQYFGRRNLGTTIKDDGSPVTAADRLVETALREMLGQSRPQDAIVGEELGADENGGRRWFIDPIDGTAGFLAGKPGWRTLIAVEADGIVQIGVASSPGIHQRWWANRRGGAWSRASGNSSQAAGAPPSRLAVSTTHRLNQAVLAIWPPSEGWPVVLRGAAARLQAASQPAPDPDPAGTRHGALLVATGRTDAFLMAGAGPWDLAAMVPIVEEAGGRFSDTTGGQSLYTGVGIFSNGALHEQILDRLRLKQ